jgi:hypothetical protein
MEQNVKIRISKEMIKLRTEIEKFSAAKELFSEDDDLIIIRFIERGIRNRQERLLGLHFEYNMET